MDRSKMDESFASMIKPIVQVHRENAFLGLNGDCTGTDRALDSKILNACEEALELAVHMEEVQWAKELNRVVGRRLGGDGGHSLMHWLGGRAKDLLKQTDYKDVEGDTGMWNNLILEKAAEGLIGALLDVGGGERFVRYFVPQWHSHVWGEA